MRILVVFVFAAAIAFPEKKHKPTPIPAETLSELKAAETKILKLLYSHELSRKTLEDLRMKSVAAYTDFQQASANFNNEQNSLNAAQSEGFKASEDARKKHCGEDGKINPETFQCEPPTPAIPTPK